MSEHAESELFSQEVINRFEAKYIRTSDEDDNCWEWQASRDSKGYGMIWNQGHHMKAHRFSWMLANQQLIPEGLVVRHICDYQPCVRPDHLVLGTEKDNKQDWLDRGFIPVATCVNGHEMTEANTYYSIRLENGRQRRHCIMCRKVSKKNVNARLKRVRQNRKQVL